MINFKLFNILASCKRYINKIFVKKLDIYIIVYLEEILFYNKNSNNAYIDIMFYLLD